MASLTKFIQVVQAAVACSHSKDRVSTGTLLLARLMGQYCFIRWRL